MVVDDKPVRDDSFLTASARDLCKHKTIFWAHPGCLDTGMSHYDATYSRSIDSMRGDSCDEDRSFHLLPGSDERALNIRLALIYVILSNSYNRNINFKCPGGHYKMGVS